jgi:hypothetical protein
MTVGSPDVVPATLRRLTTILAPALVVAFGVAWLIWPELRLGMEDRNEMRVLEQHVTGLERAVRARRAQPTETVDAVRQFDERVPPGDRTSDMVALLARLALDPPNTAEARGLLVETGTPSRATGGATVPPSERDRDPRVELFPAALEHEPVTLRFEATYERLGNFLWRLRDLPTLTDVRSLDVKRGPALSRVELTLFVFHRARGMS